MFSNVITAGKDLANKISNKFLNLSDIEVKVKEATNDEPWGPHGSLMREIADETFSTMNFNDIMTFLWYRMFTERPISAKRTYKGLVLLSYLIVNGSEFVAVSCREHLSDLRRLNSFVDSHGNPDYLIIKKSRDVCDLLGDADRIAAERRKAREQHGRLSINNSPSAGSGEEENGSAAKSRPQLGNFDEWQPTSPSISSRIGETFMNIVNAYAQIVGGPPPTETHDNYDIPPTSISDTDQRRAAGTSKTEDWRRIQKQNVAEKRREEVTSVPPDKVQKEVVSKKEEPPIIDLLINDVATAAIPATQQQPVDDFGDFFAYRTESVQPQPFLPQAQIMRPNDSVVLPRTNMTSSVADGPHVRASLAVCENNGWVADFDRLNRQAAPTRLPPRKAFSVDECPSSMLQSKVNVKVGETWKDLNSLNIDLDNLCGFPQHRIRK